MIIDCERERDQYRAYAGGREFGQGQGAGATDDDVGPGIGRSHVFDKRLHARFDLCDGVRRACAIREFRPALPAMHKRSC